jgi:uncharacterized protein YecT (DUF1311 family)
MKALKISFLFLLFVPSVFAQTQTAMDNKAKSEFDKVDAELNQIYQKIIHDYSDDSIFIKNLREAQRLWVKFRDAQVNMKYPSDEEGSVFPMCRYYYLSELTSERIKELKPWLEGVEEGDDCAGSIKIK